MSSAALRLLHGAPRISAGVLTADLRRLGEELALLEEAGVELVHIDVMDGVFCPQMTVGPPFVKAVSGPFIRDVHLMIDQPETKVESFVEAGADIISFQIEASRHPHRVARVLAQSGVLAGAALNPGTPVTAVEPLLDELDYVLLLAVDPGWSGQCFGKATAGRLSALRDVIGDRPVAIGVDGGVTKDNVAAVAALGPDVIVTGSAVFDGKTPLENARFMIDETRSRV